ncbi:hypothetical protein POM88_027273 [Heracleum sosnowskyi]|uniref:Biotin carboxylation domain-containing protein n=1 Tax=Heracleum sosnowskyi TaxID=360622 RepID=A0AAD8I7G4_9APIA|nr:hypothetical protein POM88_027273 [Heracleum sosnowskyi]
MNQKLLEEAPSPALTAELRKAMGDAAAATTVSIRYIGVGTVEFHLDTRIQGREATLQTDIVLRGHSVECRINAEDAFKKFRPGPGRITTYFPDGGPFVRMDCHVYLDYLVPSSYDSLLGIPLSFVCCMNLGCVTRTPLILGTFEVDYWSEGSGPEPTSLNWP